MKTPDPASVLERVKELQCACKSWKGWLGTNSAVPDLLEEVVTLLEEYGEAFALSEGDITF